MSLDHFPRIEILSIRYIEWFSGEQAQNLDEEEENIVYNQHAHIIIPHTYTNLV